MSPLEAHAAVRERLVEVFGERCAVLDHVPEFARPPYIEIVGQMGAAAAKGEAGNWRGHETTVFLTVVSAGAAEAQWIVRTIQNAFVGWSNEALGLYFRVIEARILPSRGALDHRGAVTLQILKQEK